MWRFSLFLILGDRLHTVRATVGPKVELRPIRTYVRYLAPGLGSGNERDWRRDGGVTAYPITRFRWSIAAKCCVYSGKLCCVVYRLLLYWYLATDRRSNSVRNRFWRFYISLSGINRISQFSPSPTSWRPRVQKATLTLVRWPPTLARSLSSGNRWQSSRRSLSPPPSNSLHLDSQ